MASVHKDPRKKSKFYYAAFREKSGRRVFRSTGSEDKEEAMRLALEFERPYRESRKAKTEGREGAVPSDDALPVIQKLYRLSASGKLTEDNAREMLAELVRASGSETLRTPSLREYSSEWLRSKEATNSPRTLDRYRGIITSLTESLGPKRSDKDIALIRPGDIREYRDGILKAGKAKTSANVELKIIRSMFTQARREGLILSNPADGVATLKASQQEREPFTVDQLAALLRVASQEWQTMILLGCYTGARLGECVRMRWENIDLQRSEIRYSPQKQGVDVDVTSRPDWRKMVASQACLPICDELAEHLLSLPGTDNPIAFLCPSLAGRRISKLSEAFMALIERAEIVQPETKDVQGKGRKFRALSFHSTRHTFVSWLANGDVPAEVRKALSGHSDDEAHQRYVHMDMDVKRRAIVKLPRIKG